MIRATLVLPLACLALTACATTEARTDQAARDDMGQAITQPFEDFNISRKGLPPALKAAAEWPYRPPEPLDCAGVNAAVAELNAVLGPDLDALKVERSRMTRGGSAASKAALGAVRSATTGWIPFRGIVRQISGAERIASDARAAVLAGFVRRAYLKGVGERLGCPVPASPLPQPPAQ